MPSSKLFFIFSLCMLQVESIQRVGHELLSPCPRIFTYDTNQTSPDKWYGTIKLDNLNFRQGFALRLSFDRQSIQLGNWLGPVQTTNNKDYVIENYNLERPIIHFYIKYNPREAPPKLVSLYINNKRICPEELLPTQTGKVNSICGTVVKQNGSNSSRIPEEGEFPWHASLYHTKGIGLGYICAASLISNSHVITAAHCITERRSQDVLNRANLVVYLGKHYLTRFSRPGIIQERQVARIFPHSSYNAKTYANNIGLVKFTTPVEFTDYIRPICLWKESSDLRTVIGKQGTVVGWDIDSFNRSSEEALQPVNLPVVSQESCINSNRDIYSRFVLSNNYCAGYKNGTSLCRGDYGAGMFFPMASSYLNRQVWQLRGIVSLLINLRDPLKCDGSEYVVFEDVAKHLDWIVNTMTI